jgi:pathogenesis-related protein 1
MRRVVNWCLRGLNAILVGAGIPVAVVYGMQQQGELKVSFPAPTITLGTALDEDGEKRRDSYTSFGSYLMTSKGPKLDGVSSEPVRSFECRAERLKEDERAAFLKAHNDARAVVGLEPLNWSDELATYSLEWLQETNDKYVAAVIGSDIKAKRNLPPIEHRPREGLFAQKFGENIYGSYASPPPEAGTTGPKAVASWLAEKQGFDTLNSQKPYVVGDEKGTVVGHYTQIIWKDTTKVGASKWICKTKDNGGNEYLFEVVLANYDPPGNDRGKSPLNPGSK